MWPGKYKRTFSHLFSQLQTKPGAPTLLQFLVRATCPYFTIHAKKRLTLRITECCGEDPLKENDLSRRKLVKLIGSAAFAASFRSAGVLGSGMECGDALDSLRIPKIALELSKTGPNFATGAVDEAGMRRVKQLGVNDVLMGGPAIPWLEADLRTLMDKLKTGGLTLGNLMISGFPRTLYGKAGRDEEIEKIQQSIRAAGRVGLPVIEYNFYAHRLVEGYYAETGRAGEG